MERTATTRTEPGSRQSLEAALEFAREAHNGQTRKQGGRPYIDHPVAVTELLADRGVKVDLLAAAYLHDVVEKTDVSLGEIDRRFGAHVAELVDSVSEDESIESYTERKRSLRRKALKAGEDASLLFAADRVANLRDWNALAPAQRKGIAESLGTTFGVRVELWREDLAELSEHYPGLPLLAEVEIELRALTAEAT